MLRGPEPRPDGLAQQRRCRHLAAWIGVQRAQLAVLAKARQRLLELDDELPCSLCGGGRRKRSGAWLANQQPHVRSHRLEGDVVFAHDALVVTGAGAGAAVVGAELVTTGLELELDVMEAPALEDAAGTTVVTTRRRITRRTSTLLGAVEAALADADRRVVSGAKLVGEKAEQHREGRRRGRDHGTRAGAAARAVRLGRAAASGGLMGRSVIGPSVIGRSVIVSSPMAAISTFVFHLTAGVRASAAAGGVNRSGRMARRRCAARVGHNRSGGGDRGRGRRG